MAKHSEIRVSGDRVVAIRMPLAEAFRLYSVLDGKTPTEWPAGTRTALEKYFRDIGYLPAPTRT